MINKSLNYDILRKMVHNILNVEDRDKILERCDIACDWILENEIISSFQRNLLLDLVIVIRENYW